jgi:predicted metal-binding membrane protein
VLVFFIGAWVVMMAAMMFPSIAPMVLMHVRIQAERRERGQAAAIGATALFVGGYLIAWTAAGLAGYGSYQLGKAASGDVFSWDNAGPYLAGAIVLAAALYQLTPAEGRLPAALPQPLHVPDEALAVVFAPASSQA